MHYINFNPFFVNELNFDIQFPPAALFVFKFRFCLAFLVNQKTYSRHQLLVLVLFRDFRNQHYREDPETFLKNADLG